MQIGFDVGATKIESVILKDNGEEVDRSRRDCPKDYISIVQTIKDVVVELEKNIIKYYQLVYVIQAFILHKQD